MVPPLRRRLLPLLVFGSIVAAIRLAMDSWDQDGAMWFGLYYTMPMAIAYIGLTGHWGAISWPKMAGTMLVVGFLVWGVWNSIAYTTGQFMEWQGGRYFPGHPELKDGVVVYDDTARADRIRETATGKIAAGLLHGLLSSILSTIWCTVAGTLFIWLPAKMKHRNEP